MLYLCYTIDNENIDLRRPSICFNYTDALEELTLNFKRGLIDRISDYLSYDPSIKKILPKEAIKFLKNTLLIKESELKEVPFFKITDFIDVYLKDVEWNYTTNSYSIFDYGMDSYEEYGCFKSMNYFKNIEYLNISRTKREIK